MKTTLLSAVAISILELALAQPHPHAHRRMHKRDLVTKAETKTLTGADAVVFVDEAGAPLSTSYMESAAVAAQAVPETTHELDVPTTETPSTIESKAEETSHAHASLVQKSSVEAAETPKPVDLPVDVAQLPTPLPAVPLPSALPPLPLPLAINKFPLGIAYSPYIVNGCKTKEQTQADFEKMEGYGIIRLYGTDCSQIQFGVAAAQATNKKLIVGIYNIQEIDAAVTIIKNEGGDFSTINLITVGNEQILKGTEASTIVAAVKDARTKLASIGYKGLISSVDTFGDTIAHKELCDNSDITTINAQAFFTKSVTADQAGQYVLDRVNDVRDVCGKDKMVVVTESGWPSAGDPNGAAVPGRDQQRKAIASLKEKFKDGNMILFTAFNDEWKTDFAGSFNAEKHYGILDQ